MGMRLAIAVLLLGTCGYAPPAFTTHVGAPVAVDDAEGAVHVAASYGGVNLALPELGGSIRLNRGLRLELGSSFAGADGSTLGWLLGRAGLRYGERVRDAAWDLEAGGAAGVGGNCSGNDPELLCDPDDPFDIYDRPAGGAYAGFGVAHWIDENAIFFRTRAQVGVAANVPVTFWGSAVAGVDIEFEILRAHVAAGGYVYANQFGSFIYFLVEAGVTIPIGNSAETRAPRPPPSEELDDPGFVQ